MAEVNSFSPAGVGLLAKAFGILDLFGPDQPTWSQAEIVRECSLNRSTVSRVMRYLNDAGYLVQFEQNGRYALGLAAIDLGRRAGSSFDLRALGQPEMGELSRSTDETIILTELSRPGHVVTCVDQIVGRHGGLRVFERVGATFPLHAGAAPKAILALMPVSQREAFLSGRLEKLSAGTMTDADAIRADLDATVARGYAISREETYQGVAGVAAGFLGPDGAPAGSLAIAAPLQRVSPEKIDAYGTMVMQSSRRLSALLGRQPEIASGSKQ